MSDWFLGVIDDEPVIDIEKLLDSVDVDKFLTDSGYVKKETAFGSVWIKEHEQY